VSFLQTFVNLFARARVYSVYLGILFDLITVYIYLLNSIIILIYSTEKLWRKESKLNELKNLEYCINIYNTQDCYCTLHNLYS